MVAGEGEMVYGVVPPPGVSTTLPVGTQAEGCVAVADNVTGPGPVNIVADTVAEQLLVSVTVYVYVPGASPVVAGVGEMVYGLVPPLDVRTTLPVETQAVGWVIVLVKINAGGTALIVTEVVAVQETPSVTV